LDPLSPWRWRLSTIRAAMLVPLIVSNSASILGASARRASSAGIASSNVNSRSEKPVFTRDAAVGVIARRRRTSVRRLVAIALDGLIASAARSADTASSN